MERLAKAASDLNEAEESTVEAASKTTGDEVREYAAETEVNHYATKAYNDLTDHIEFKTIEKVDDEKQKLHQAAEVAETNDSLLKEMKAAEEKMAAETKDQEEAEAAALVKEKEKEEALRIAAEKLQ